ncbi:MAG: hypothetical protein OER91_08470, partial [Gammaproteobacteria bacterium]|nr:hypothetical protein [Gammaproteobacteria bacterium]
MSASLDTLPKILRDPVARWLERYGESDESQNLVRLVACSEFAGNVVLREKQWVAENLASFEQAPDAHHLDAFVADIGNSEASVGDVQSQLRRYRNQFMLHVVWREVFGVASLDETLRW